MEHDRTAALPARHPNYAPDTTMPRDDPRGIIPGRYLREEHFTVIRARIDRVEAVTADVVDALASLPAASIDAFALSNVFEYSPAELFERGKREVARAARPGARVALRNLLAPRSLDGDAAFALDRALGRTLQFEDRAFIYSRFEAARVRASS